MLELQCCAGLVKAPALCSIEKQVSQENLNPVTEIAAELQREREKNALLMERIALLEAQIQESNTKASPVDEQENCANAKQISLKKFKRQKIEQNSHGSEDGILRISKTASNARSDRIAVAPICDLQHHLVSWMCMDESQLFPSDETKDGNFNQIMHCDESDGIDDEDHYSEDDDAKDDHKDKHKHDADKLPSKKCFHTELTVPIACDTRKQEKDVCSLARTMPINRKSPKVPFCPKEVKRMLESDTLQLKDAQSHTIRKIIVFASLGTRHGCEDMYELDFNHFSILNKGKPYVSQNEPGEHVLYENPGIRRKIFYPNRRNPALCPVQIFEEEKAMRPSDPTCPSCLFLCIKYGGRTRNLPQNEYVRQRMGRNKLKSFGPIICRMAMLVHIRGGSFFFKALGITLLFMAGFPGDIVQRETKYRSLDLLQKYFRRDEDAEGEELFLSHPLMDIPSPCASPEIPTQTNPTKQKGRKRKQTNTLGKCNSLLKPSPHRSSSPSSLNTNHTQSQAAIDPLFKFPGPHISYSIQTPHNMVAASPQPAGTFMPLIFWPPPNAFPYPASYPYHSYPPSPNYISIHPHPFFNLPSSSPCNPNVVQGTEKGELEEAATDVDSSSSTKEVKEVMVSNKANSKVAASVNEHQ